MAIVLFHWRNSDDAETETKIGSLEERCAAQAAAKLEAAKRLPSGNERDKIERKAQQLQTATQLDKWIGSPGLQPPI